jgi:uncharacterized protein (TIGR03067 family)
MNALSLLTVCLLPVAAEDAAKKDLAAMQGTWKVEKLEYNGKDGTDKYSFRLVFKGNTGTITNNDEVAKDYGRATFKLDPSTTPKCVDLTIGGGVQKGVVLEGIYEVKGDQMKLCVKVVGNERPTKFASPGGESIAFLILKRQQK